MKSFIDETKLKTALGTEPAEIVQLKALYAYITL